MIKDVMTANENVAPSAKELAVLREHFPACFAADGSFDIERFKEYLLGLLDMKVDGSVALKLQGNLKKTAFLFGRKKLSSVKKYGIHTKNTILITERKPDFQ